jgi:2-methylisocitrate lyase-like PEP mutase family enzyme
VPREVLSFEVAVAKISAAVEARDDTDFLVIGRTDNTAYCGLDEAIRRAKAFERAGSAAVFVELKGHAGILADIRRVSNAVAILCMVNIDAGGPLATLQADQLHTHGIALAIYPALIRQAVGFAMRDALQHLRADGNTQDVRPRMLTSQEYNECLGLPEVEAWEQRFPE